jgi:trans-aconitate methyltransferase
VQPAKYCFENTNGVLLDKWKFFGITHRYHRICNPTSQEKYDRLLALLPLSANDPVLEIASGKGELMAQLVERYGITGVAVDQSPYFVEDTRALFADRIPDADVTLLEMDGAEYRADQDHSFSMAACIGASWIFGGHPGTLQALMQWTRPGGLILVGEPFWITEPEPEYLAASEFTRDEFGTHRENVTAGEELGLTLMYTLVSSEDDWDHYEGLTWYASERHLKESPDDPDNKALKTRVDRDREIYLTWQRGCLGWAMYLFQNPA